MAAIPLPRAARSVLRNQPTAMKRPVESLASGALLDRGWLPAQLYFFFSAPFVLAAIAILFVRPARHRPTSPEPIG
jgi:hypothetical protein